MATLLKQEVKGTVQRKDVSAMHLCTAAMSKQARKYTSGLSCSVYLRLHDMPVVKPSLMLVYVSSWNLPGQGLVTALLTPCALRDKMLLYHSVMMSSSWRLETQCLGACFITTVVIVQVNRESNIFIWIQVILWLNISKWNRMVCVWFKENVFVSHWPAFSIKNNLNE